LGEVGTLKKDVRKSLDLRRHVSVIVWVSGTFGKVNTPGYVFRRASAADSPGYSR
jgi:hypothetical protein